MVSVLDPIAQAAADELARQLYKAFWWPDGLPKVANETYEETKARLKR